MRGRALFVVMAIAGAVVVAIAGVLALDTDGSAEPPAGTIAVDVSALRPGEVMPIDVTLPSAKHEQARVFVVRSDDTHAQALLGVSTHLGCRLLWRADSRFGVGVAVNDRVEYEDPCGGSLYAMEGECIGGPCPRGVDRYPVTLDQGIAEIDLTQLQKGPARYASSPR